jgi:phage terminase small subunit
MSLTNKQTVFIAEYLKDFNATQAAIRAGYSAKTAYSIGQENLNKPEIKAEVSRLISERIMSADEVLIRLADIARGDMADLMDITSSGFTLKLMNDGQVIPQTKLIRKIKQKITTRLAKDDSGEDSETIETEIELYSAHDALRDIGRHHKLFTDNTEISLSGKIVNVTIDGEGLQENDN